MDAFQKDLNGILVWNPSPSDDETVSWIGETFAGYADGRGTLTWYYKGKEISSFKGTMKKGKPHGTGKYLFADGDSYDGEWVDGLRHGRGKQVFSDGSIYDGEWLFDKRPE